MHDFDGCYEQLCCLQSTMPLQFVKVHLKEGVLDINGDKVRMIDWAPILDSIKINKSLRFIAIRSFFQIPNGSSCKKSHYFKRKTPAICVKDVTQWIATSLRSCLKVSATIKCLDLQGVPLREKDIALLSKGIESNVSLSYVSLNYCQIADKSVRTFCHSVRNHPCITHMSLSGCNITPRGTEEIAKLIKHQSTLRHSDAWAESLRYRTPNLNCMGGIRRITLNANPMIGDDGMLPFTEALKDDLWLKALDFQQCGISSKGALALLGTMQYNNTLVVLDLRQNPMVDSTTLRTVLGRVLMNANENDESDYPWIKEEPPKDPYCTKRYKPPKGTNKNYGKKANVRLSKNSADSFQTKLKSAPRYKSSRAWQAAVQASQSESRLSDDVKSEDESSSEKALNSRIMALEVENARLKKELATTYENSRLKSQLDDDMLLDSIEQSFNKFHDFLNRLHDAGLGSLASAAGLGEEFSLPFQTKTTFNETASPRVQKTIENSQHLPVSDPIVLQTGPKLKEQVEKTAKSPPSNGESLKEAAPSSIPVEDETPKVTNTQSKEIDDEKVEDVETYESSFESSDSDTF